MHGCVSQRLGFPIGNSLTQQPRAQVFEGPLLTAFISFLLNDRSVRVASAATAANALHKVAAFMATEVLDVAESAAAQA